MKYTNDAAINYDKMDYVPAYARDGVGAVSYRMLDCPEQIVIAQVDDKGLLSSGSLTGISSLLITSQETFGVNQTLVLAVKVSSRAVVCNMFTPCILLYIVTKSYVQVTFCS